MPTYRAWVKSEIDTIYKVMKEYAPWRGPEPWEDTEFLAAWLNNFQLIEQTTGQPTTEEQLINWWKSTQEYKDNENWEPEPGPNPPEPGTNPIAGQVRISGSGYSDNNGPLLPIGLHLGDIFSKFTRDRGHAERYLSLANQAGYKIIQFWMNLGTLGGSYWSGREVGPNFTPDFWGQLNAFSDLLDSYGLKGVYNLGDYKLRGMSHEEFSRTLGQQLVNRDTAAFNFAGNEAWQTGADNINTLVDYINNFALFCPDVIKTTTSPPSEESSDIDAWCAGDFYAIHGYRGGEDHDRIRHIFSVPWEGNPPSRFGYQDEPTGPGSEVSVKPSHCYNGRDVDANHMCALAFQSLMCNQAFNYFCSEGVKSDGDITKRAGFYEVPKVANLLPLDVMSWDTAFHFGDSQSGRRIFAPRSGNHVRFDHRIAPDGRFVGLFYGDEGQATATCVRPCTLTMLNWDDSVVIEHNFNKNDVITIDFARSQNGQPGHTAMPVTGKLR